jgi:serine/threonine-protein kinase RsbW
MDLRLEITTRSTLAAVRRIGTLLRLGLGDAVGECVAGAVELAAVEACTNVVKHGARDRPQLPLQVSLELDPESVVVVIRDSGEPFDVRRFQRATFDLHRPETLPTSGMGLGLIHDIMDRIEYQSTASGNITTLVKELRNTVSPRRTASPS